MALRRNPQRSCQERTLPTYAANENLLNTIAPKETSTHQGRQNASVQSAKRSATKPRRRRERTLSRQMPGPKSTRPFPFFELPREIRDHVYSTLVVQQSATGRSIIAATPLLANRKRRLAAQVNRERLNQKRILGGRPPIQPRKVEAEPVVDLDVFRASQRLNQEANDCFYTYNWFAITLTKLPLTTFETPFGWDLSRVTRLQVEVQMKDAAHMNSYVDWMTFFNIFPSLRFLRIIPTFHPRYYYWALPELSEWTTTHYIHKAFFRELLASLPDLAAFEAGLKSERVDDLQLQGKSVAEKVVEHMYDELGS